MIYIKVEMWPKGYRDNIRVNPRLEALVELHKSQDEVIVENPHRVPVDAIG